MAYTKEEKKVHEDKYDLNSGLHRQMIIAFEKEVGNKNFMEILKDKGYFKVTDYYPDGVVVRKYIEEIYDTQEKYKALGKLIERRKYAKKQEEEAFNNLK